MEQPASVRPKKKRSRWRVIVLLALLLLVVLAITFPNNATGRSPTTARKNACINNLRQIDGAKEQWALEKNVKRGEPVKDAEVCEYIKGGIPICQDKGIYNFGKVGEAPTCSFATHKL